MATPLLSVVPVPITVEPFLKITVAPVISPVWGVLDKNYKPEEIVDKTEAMVKSNTGFSTG